MYNIYVYIYYIAGLYCDDINGNASFKIPLNKNLNH